MALSSGKAFEFHGVPLRRFATAKTFFKGHFVIALYECFVGLFMCAVSGEENCGPKMRGEDPESETNRKVEAQVARDQRL